MARFVYPNPSIFGATFGIIFLQARDTLGKLLPGFRHQGRGPTSIRSDAHVGSGASGPGGGAALPGCAAERRLEPAAQAPGAAGHKQPAGRIRAPAGDPPPKASQALRLRLAELQPRLQILAPADDAVLPIAPWSLDLSLEDWPLADAGALGLGAHLVVQLDAQAPLRLGPKDPEGPISKDTRLSVAMAPLSPGSHRLTVYAARPWGEAVKDPGAAVQIRLHGLAANPLSQPLRGTPSW